MRKFLCAAFMAAIFGRAAAQENYAVSSIPKALLNRAAAVVRTNEMVIEVNGLDDVSYKEKTAITVMNSAGDDDAEVVIFYDKIRQIKSVKGTIYNEFGLPAGKFSEKDFRDESAVSNASLYQDDRVKYYKPAQVSYPYTIVYEYEIKARQSLYFPEWRPVTTAGVSLEKSSLRFVCPASFKLRHLEINYPGKVDESEVKGIKTYSWTVTDIPALRAEPYSPDTEKFLTCIKLAPESFAFKGIRGSFANWNDYGKWMYDNLLKGRDALPPATVQYVKDLVSGITDPKIKAKKIYEYMQDKTRYISVQIGIGGFQPYPAAEVDRVSYGDCKGLVNYTHALLKAADIESYYCIVNSGSFKKSINTEFASINDGDHIILCLPFKGDTTWLECTNKKIPFGFLGDFTDDRYVLACTPDGGKVLHTPKFDASANRQMRKAVFKLSDKGDLDGKISTRFEGTQYDNHDILEGEPLKEQVKHLSELYPLPNLEVMALEFKKQKDIKPVTLEDISFSSRGYGSINAGRMYLSLNVINKMSRAIPDIRNRTNPLYINRGFVDEDEYTFELPENLKVEFNPGTTTIEKPFGKYSSTITVKGNTVTYHRTMQLNEGTYPKEQYAEFVQFYQKIGEADNEKLVLKL